MEKFSADDFVSVLEKLFGKDCVKIYSDDTVPRKEAIKGSCKPCECKKESTPNNHPTNSNIVSYAGYEAKAEVDKDGNRTGTTLTFCVPGLDMDQINITEENNIITVSSDCEVKFFGKLYQKTKMKNIYDMDKISAKLLNGILSIYIPVSKKASSNVRKIKIG